MEWTKKDKYEFRILQPDKLAALWGEQKKKSNMDFAKLARGLRYYYGKSILEKVRGKQFTYQFVMDIDAILANDSDGGTSEGGDRSTPDVCYEAPGSVGQREGFGGIETESTGTKVGLEEGYGGKCKGFRCTTGILRDTGGVGEGVIGTRGILRDTSEEFGGTGGGFLGNVGSFESTGTIYGGAGEEFGTTPEGFGDNGEGWGVIKGEFGEIKAFDFSILIESNATSSFYEAL